MSYKIDVRDLNVHFGENQALKNVNIQIEENMITAIIGPSGCGKSTFVRSINRMNDVVPTARTAGQILVDGNDVFGKDVDVVDVRKKFGQELRMWGGVDKRSLARGKHAIDDEIARVRPLIEEGGYVAHPDHSLPPDVPLENFVYYLERLRTAVSL